MKRKLGLLALAVFFLLTSAVTGTLAYQVSAVDDAMPTQSDGPVQIKNHLTKRNTGLSTLVYFTIGQDNLTFVEQEPLYVAVYDDQFQWETEESLSLDGNSYKMWDKSQISNALDRIAFVENTGGVDCYVRTIFAIEADKTGFKGTLLHLNRNETHWDWQEIPGVMIDGVKHDLYIATYKSTLAPGQHTAPSLLQIAMDSKAGNKEVMQFGEYFEIKILSQAVDTTASGDAQTVLNEAFGVISEDNVPAFSSN